MITHGEPASVPRSCSSSAVCSYRGEPEGSGEGLGADQVRFLELEPGQVADLDQGVFRAAGVLSAPGALLAVQSFVGVDCVWSRSSPRLTDDIVTYEWLRQSRVSDEILKIDGFC